VVSSLHLNYSSPDIDLVDNSPNQVFASVDLDK